MIAPRSRIGLIVDHPKRDLPGCLAVAHALARHGIETFLIPLYDQGFDVPLLALDALVINYARPVNLGLVASYVSAGMAVYVLDTEGGVLADDGPNTPNRLAAYVSTSGYAELLAGYFFWGPVLRDAFAADGGMPIERLHLTGCPRFDFAASDNELLRNGKRSGHILINTNYPAVNPRFAGTANDKEALVSAGLKSEYVERLLEDTRKIMTGVIETTKRLAVSMPEQQFVLRPHPFENSSAYREAFAGQANIEVDPDGNVIDALTGAKALLHLNCGTAVEALMLGITPYSLDFLNTELMANHASLPSRVSQPVPDFETLAGWLGGSPSAPMFNARECYTKYVAPYFHLNDGRAADRVAQSLVADLNRPRPLPRASLAKSLASSRRRPRLAQRLQAITANLVGSAASSRLRASIQPARLDKAFSITEVQRGLDRLATHDGLTPSRAARARHPLTNLPLTSVRVVPAAPGTSGS